MLRWLSDVMAAWIAARREARARREFERGFNYAAGALLKSTDVDELEADIDCSFNPSSFDDGMEAAIVAWSQHFPGADEPSVWPKIAA